MRLCCDAKLVDETITQMDELGSALTPQPRATLHALVVGEELATAQHPLECDYDSVTCDTPLDVITAIVVQPNHVDSLLSFDILLGFVS